MRDEMCSILQTENWRSSKSEIAHVDDMIEKEFSDAESILKLFCTTAFPSHEFLYIVFCLILYSFFNFLNIFSKNH